MATVGAVLLGMGLSIVPPAVTWSLQTLAANGGPAVAAALVAGWMWALSFLRSRDRRVVGAGAQEFVRVGNATWWTFAVLVVVSFVLDAESARNYVAVTFPLGIGLLVAGRAGWRMRLRAARVKGGALASVLVVGTPENAGDLIRTFQKMPTNGYGASGVCLTGPAADRPAEILGVPVVGTADRVADIASELGVDVVAVTGSDATTADYVRRLGWSLNPKGIGLMIAGALADVAGPRIIVTPVTGARLVHVDAPEFTGPKYWVKTAVDAVVASMAIALLLPLLIAIVIAIKVDSPGPALFKQVRVGRNGKPFTMFKFRSMVSDADSRLADLVRQSDGNGLIFKMRADPRVTRVGRILRRSSLDELPQLFNVARAEMSMVGPRPPLEREVAQYDGVISRRLLVKPGITGPWQVNGRSDLPLDESLRLDLNYVENWSLWGDIAILLKTVSAVSRGSGAY